MFSATFFSAHGFEALWEAVKPHGDPVESLFSFMKEHGSHYCAFRFFRSYAGRLSVSQRLRLRRLLLELHPGLLAAAEVAEATHQDLRSLITLDKALLGRYGLDSFPDEWSRRTAGAAARLQEWRRLFLQHGNRQRMESLSADLIGMSVEVFMRWDRELEDPRSAGDQQEKDPWARRRYLFEALSLVEAGLCVEPLRTSPMLHQIRVGLSFLVGDTYAIHQSFAAMEVKQILLLSMGLYLTAAQQDYETPPSQRSLQGYAAPRLKQLLSRGACVGVQYTDYLSAAVEEGSFSWLPEFRLWGLITQHSLDGLLVTLQDALYRLYERGGFGPSDLLFNVPTEPAMADLVRGGALRARALNRGPLEWWLTTMAVMPPVADAWGEAVGALGGLTCSDLGASCISLLPPEELHARELTHPIRRALVLHKTRKIVLKRASPTQQAAAEGEDVQSINKEQQQTAGAPGEQEGPCEAAILEATFQAEEKALFAVWQANLQPKIWHSAWPSRLLGAEANHALTRHNFIQGPPRPDVSLTAGAPGTAETLTGEAGDRQLYVPWLSDGEREVLDALASGSLGASRQDQEGEGGGHRCGKREDEGQPPSPSLEKRADCSWNWTVPWCSAPHCAARRHPKEPLTGACEGERPRGAPQESLPDENGAKNAADVLSGAEGAFKEAVSSLRRSIPGRARRLRLLFAVLRPSVGFNEEQLREMDRFVAELKQVIDASQQLRGKARKLDSERSTKRVPTSAMEKGVSTEATVAVSNHLCEALDGCRDCMMACCTAILDGIGELKGLGRPLLAGENVRLSLFDALFVLSQVGVVSLALIGTLFQQLALWHQALCKTQGVKSTVFSVMMTDAQPSIDAFLECLRAQHKSVSRSDLALGGRFRGMRGDTPCCAPAAQKCALGVALTVEELTNGGNRGRGGRNHVAFSEYRMALMALLMLVLMHACSWQTRWTRLCSWSPWEGPPGWSALGASAMT
ncbi:uncharacterized protein LOC34621127 [Cyclospora cayetanensis]|uniref:Uncharacterized protein LOC34621127 n=1 Tax=Cyclospora cayetanensis TaxID=88456 RepID=A0A6P6RTS0_9EIME|nr:uncharacterized protein LOC34621127 [Cyclospora cayetanensis]